MYGAQTVCIVFSVQEGNLLSLVEMSGFSRQGWMEIANKIASQHYPFLAEGANKTFCYWKLVDVMFGRWKYNYEVAVDT